jgi:hypothetical protein
MYLDILEKELKQKRLNDDKSAETYEIKNKKI